MRPQYDSSKAKRRAMPRREKDLLARDAKRDVGRELLQAIRDVKAGRYGAVRRYLTNPAVERINACKTTVVAGKLP